MPIPDLKNFIVHLLEEMKGIDITVLDVQGLTTITDYMIICSGTSSRHLQAMASNVIENTKKEGVSPLGLEGKETVSSEWILIDYIEVVVHLMLPTSRVFYNLEKLWHTISTENTSKMSSVE